MGGWVSLRHVTGPSHIRTVAASTTWILTVPQWFTCCLFGLYTIPLLIQDSRTSNKRKATEGVTLRGYWGGPFLPLPWGEWLLCRCLHVGQGTLDQGPADYGQKPQEPWTETSPLPFRLVWMRLKHRFPVIIAVYVKKCFYACDNSKAWLPGMAAGDLFACDILRP